MSDAIRHYRVIPSLRRFLTVWTVLFGVAIVLALAGVIDPYAAAFGIGPYLYIVVRSLAGWSLSWMYEVDAEAAVTGLPVETLRSQELARPTEES